MPRGDRTGPVGMGAMSGRAAGYCAGFAMPGYANPVSGRGYGMGFGRGRGSWNRGFGSGGGRGWRHRYHASGLPGWMRFGEYAAPSGYPAPYSTPNPEREKQALKSQAEALQSELDFIKTRLAKMESESAAK